MIQSRRVSRQRGASLISLLFLALVVGFIVLMGMRAFPSVNEYLTISKAVSRIMRSNPASEADIRNSFDKTAEIEFSIHTLAGKDLKIQQMGDAGFRTSFAYNVEIPIADPVYILVKYSGSSASGGIKGP
jgi:hypothetical protein